MTEPDPQIVKVVDESLAGVRTAIIDRIDNPDQSDDPKRIYAGSGNTGPGHRLRLDWELLLDNVPTADSTKIADMIISQIAADLYDLLENGDSDDVRNPFLGVLNGRRKTGRDLTAVDLSEILLYKEYIPRKNTVEFTLYTILYAEWA